MTVLERMLMRNAENAGGVKQDASKEGLADPKDKKDIAALLTG